MTTTTTIISDMTFLRTWKEGDVKSATSRLATSLALLEAEVAWASADLEAGRDYAGACLVGRVQGVEADRASLAVARAELRTVLFAIERIEESSK